MTFGTKLPDKRTYLHWLFDKWVGIPMLHRHAASKADHLVLDSQQPSSIPAPRSDLQILHPEDV